MPGVHGAPFTPTGAGDVQNALGKRHRVGRTKHTRGVPLHLEAVVPAQGTQGRHGQLVLHHILEREGGFGGRTGGAGDGNNALGERHRRHAGGSLYTLTGPTT